MTGQSPAGVAAVRIFFTGVVALLLLISTFYSAMIGLWMYAWAGERGSRVSDLIGPLAALLVVMAIMIGTLAVQLRWANCAHQAGAIARRSLLVLAAPTVVIVVLLAASW